jgi:hypothetical protein
VIGEVEQYEDHHEHDRHDDLQPLTRADLVFPAAAPGRGVAGWHPDVACDRQARLFDEAANVTSLDVQQHRSDQQPVLR